MTALGPKRFAFTIVTLLLILAAPLLAVEGLLRVLHRAEPIVSGWKVAQSPQHRFQFNELGYRGASIKYDDSDFVILLVGDSQVEAEACSYYWMPERRLEHHLSNGRHVRVFSLAAEGWGQDQELLALKEYYSRYRADLVVVWQTPNNDLWNNTFPTGDPAGADLKPTYRLDRGVLLGPTSRIGEVVSSPFRIVTAYEKQFVSWDREWERYLPPAYQPMLEYHGTVKKTWQSYWDQKLGNISTDNMATEKSHQAINLIPRSARMQYAIDLTHRLLEEMSNIARANRSSFLTFWVNTPNNEFDIENDEQAVFVLNGKYYRVSGRQKSLTMADVNGGFESYVLPKPSGEYRVGPTDGHLNEHAVDEVMQQLARIIQNRTTGS